MDCPGSFHSCKLGDVIPQLDEMSSKISERVLIDLNSGKAVLCTYQLDNMEGYDCKSFNDGVKPEYSLIFYENLGTVCNERLKHDSLRYSKYKMSAYVDQECEEIHDISTFVGVSCASDALTSKAISKVKHGMAGSCTEFVNEASRSSYISCESRVKDSLSHVFSESGYYICSLKEDIPIGNYKKLL